MFVFFAGSPSNVTLTFDNIRLFTLAWERPFTPVGYEPHNYTVIIQYKPSASQTNTETVIIQASNETEYTYEYSVPSEQLPLSVCNQFVFMVVSTSGLGDSQPVSRSWEKLSRKISLSTTYIIFSCSMHCESQLLLNLIISILMPTCVLVKTLSLLTCTTI